MFRFRFFLSVLSSAILIFVSFTLADTPALISFQGILKDSGGNPVNGNVNLTFTIYDDSLLSNPGNILWQETHLNVPVATGLFNVVLGQGSPSIPLTDTVFSDPDRWIGIRVQGGDEQLPRTKFLTAPFSHRISTIDGATGGTITGAITSSVDGVDFFMVPRGAIIMWSGTLANIPAGWALCDGNNGTPDLRNKFIYGVASGEDPGGTGGNASIPDHTHVVDIPQFNSSATGFTWSGAPLVGVSEIADYRHTHAVNPPPTSSSADGATSIIPPYYRLAFIMKL
jgi:hypothetical protein